MKKQLFNELLESVKEAVAIERGTRPPSRKFEIKNVCGVLRLNKQRLDGQKAFR